MKDTGVLRLQGKCGRTTDVHMSHCAPCHLPDIDGTIDPRLAEDTDSICCEVCGTEEREDVLIICDLCVQGYHIFCLQPPLDRVPDGDWICPVCAAEGYTLQDAFNRAEQREQLRELEERPNLFPDAKTKRRDEAAALLDGRLVKKIFNHPVTGAPTWYWGKIKFLGALARPKYFQVVYELALKHI